MDSLAADNKYSAAQIFIRGFVYLAISVSTELLSVLSGAPIEPRIAGVKLFISGLLTLRAYLDKTPSHGTGESTPDVIETTSNAIAKRVIAASRERS